MDEHDVEVQDRSRSTNGKAIASIVLGLVGLTGVLFVAAIVAIVLGRKAREEIEGSDQRGGALATTGIVLGWTGLVLTAAFGIYFAIGMTEVL